MLLLLRGRFVFFLFKEPPYFTAEPESRILVEVEETVDLACGAMGEWGAGSGVPPGGGGWEVANPGQSRPPVGNGVLGVE